MSKRTPLKAGESGYVYVFLSDPGIVLKIRCRVDEYNWGGRVLNFNMESHNISIAKYSGARDMVYFPKANKTRPLLRFSYCFKNENLQSFAIAVDGIESLNTPCTDYSFDSNTSTLSMLSYLRVPPPVSVSVRWDAHSNFINGSRYICGIQCEEGTRRTQIKKQNAVDKMLESIL